MNSKVWTRSHTAGGFGHTIVVMELREDDKVHETSCFCRGCYRTAKNPAAFIDVDTCGSNGEPVDRLEGRRLALVEKFGDISDLAIATRRGAGWGTTTQRQVSGSPS